MIKKEIFIGFFIGLLANSIGLILVTFILGNGESINVVIKQSIAEGIFGKLVTIGAILNLVAFFIFIKKSKIIEQGV